VAEAIGFSSKVLTQPTSPSRLEGLCRRFTTWTATWTEGLSRTAVPITRPSQQLAIASP